MEKTGSSSTMIKGSASAAADEIAVDVHPEALCCPRCLQPLVPPVLQCAAGHLICSPCHENLPDKNKCVSCFVFIPTSYSRSHAVEGILGAIRVACPNAGCTAGKMIYYEKVEHEKVCPSKARSDVVLKMGPCGGDGGDAVDMDVRGDDRIIKVVVWHRRDIVVDAMSVMYERDGREEKTDEWGTPCSATTLGLEICLEADEYLTTVEGHIGHYSEELIVRSLTFISNRRTFVLWAVRDGERRSV